MKKNFGLVLCIIVVFFMVACSSGTTSANDKEEQRTEESKGNTYADNITPTEKECQHVYKEEVYKEAGYGVDGIKIKSCTICSDIEYLPIPALADVFELTVTNKTVHMEGSTGYVFFDIEIKNISDKKIDAISGNLTIMPPNCILELSCDFTGLSLKPNSTAVIDSYGYSFDTESDFDAVEKKVYDAEFNTIEFSFSPFEVVVEE